jgi:type IV pilus biogenesis protein CpaD/CtpE
MRALAALAAVALSGCASSTANVPALYTDEAPWAAMSCPELRAEEQRISQASSGAMGAQNMMRGSVIGLPASVVSGGAAQNRIAVYKGQLEAVGRVISKKGCPSPLPEAPNR